MRNAITIRAALIVPLLLTAGVLVAGNPPSQHEARITGTYTNMYFNKEGGDLLGEELRIVAVSGGYQGTYQVAQGEPQNLILVDIKIDGHSVTFSLPPGYLQSGTFGGTLQNGIIKSTFQRPDGSASSIILLKRGKSYWD